MKWRGFDLSGVFSSRLFSSREVLPCGVGEWRSKFIPVFEPRYLPYTAVFTGVTPKGLAQSALDGGAAGVYVASSIF